jgi:hypothetical protein
VDVALYYSDGKTDRNPRGRPRTRSRIVSLNHPAEAETERAQGATYNWIQLGWPTPVRLRRIFIVQNCPRRNGAHSLQEQQNNLDRRTPWADFPRSADWQTLHALKGYWQKPVKPSGNTRSKAGIRPERQIRFRTNLISFGYGHLPSQHECARLRCALAQGRTGGSLGGAGERELAAHVGIRGRLS